MHAQILFLQIDPIVQYEAYYILSLTLLMNDGINVVNCAKDKSV